MPPDNAHPDSLTPKNGSDCKVPETAIPPLPPKRTAPRLPREKVVLPAHAVTTRNAADLKSVQLVADELQNSILQARKVFAPPETPPLPTPPPSPSTPATPPLPAAPPLPATPAATVSRTRGSAQPQAVPQMPFSAPAAPQIIVIEKGGGGTAAKILFFVVLFLLVTAGVFYATNREAVETWLIDLRTGKWSLPTLSQKEAAPPAKPVAPAKPAPAPAPAARPRPHQPDL